nr:upf0481 protein [Quercus suber]
MRTTPPFAPSPKLASTSPTQVEAPVRLRSKHEDQDGESELLRHGFFYSQLKLPTLALGQLSVILWNNLIAFEWSPACNTEAVLTSYICFLSALIANPNDVKELRSKRILLNIGGSDEEVFKFFEELSTSSIEDPSIYRNIREEIEKHCRSKYFRNIYKYFRNPWSALGLFAAIAVVVLSFVQTYFTIYPGKDECMESICSYLKRQQIKNV